MRDDPCGPTRWSWPSSSPSCRRPSTELTEERIASCYTDDSHDDHGTFKGSGREFAVFVC